MVQSNNYYLNVFEYERNIKMNKNFKTKSIYATNMEIKVFGF